MNDPGLDQPIDHAESQVHDVHGRANDHSKDMDEEEEVVDHLMPARWWYASTAIPLLAGTFGPMVGTQLLLDV